MLPDDNAMQKRIALGLVLPAFAAFAVLALLIVPAGGPVGFDLTVTRAVQAWRGPWLDQFMIDASYLCSWQVLVAAAVLASLWQAGWRRRGEAMLIWLSLAGNEVLVGGFKQVARRARPEQAEALLPAAGYSFPSGHSFSALAFYGLVGVMLVAGRRGRGGVPIMLAVAAIAVLVGLSRVYVGAHWPTDVVASWLLGTGWLGVMAILVTMARGEQATAGPDRRRAMLVTALGLVAAWAVFVVALAVVEPGIRNGGGIGDPPAASMAVPGPSAPA